MKAEQDLVHTSCSSVGSGDEFTKLNRKIDLKLIPIITMLYLCCFLYIAGMAVDLKLTGMRYQLAAAAFFITYSLLEIPCSVVLKLLRPSIWIASITLIWGIVMVSMAFVKTWQGLVIARLFLGVAESGLAPASNFIITLWYRRDNQARPIAFYFSSATLAGVFGGLLAFCIEKMNGHVPLGGLHGWSWIFLLEGLLTIVVALVAFRVMIDVEREHLIEVLRRDTVGEPSYFEMKFVWDTLRNPKSWLQTVIYIGLTIPLYSFTLFLPTIIHALGFSATKAQLLTIPPYAAGCLSTNAFGALSDRAHKRGPFVAGLCLLGIAGYTLLLAIDPMMQPAVGYAACVIAALGMFPCVPLTLAWSAGNSGGSLHKAVIFALMGTGSGLSGICASFIYRTQDTPRFRLGHSVAIGCLCITFLGSSFAAIMYRRLNQAKERSYAEKNIVLNTKASELGVNFPVFRCVPRQKRLDILRTNRKPTTDMWSDCG
ncbi:MFS general substrate transporter [Mycena rosella]|uniref:MFS general substrate transporter n=1 Tax=Mycena rosella TaxID=1033263 RepID=A0AAD7GZC2_MYCRO|nr:MFS general substrate transporter [Mycena rosella]